jgi:CIC family chloride channel protein
MPRVDGDEQLAVPEQQSDWAADIGTRVYWLALLVGLIVGVLGSGFHLIVDALAQARTVLVAGGFDESLPFQQLVAMTDAALARYDLESYLPADAIAIARFAVVAAFVALALTIARWLVRRFAPEAGGSGVQEIEGTLLGERPLRWRRVLPVKFVGGGVALGAGFVLGREGPTVHMGGATALGVARGAGCGRHEAMALVAAGAGAGIAAAFNAPIAGVLFVVEEMRREAPYNFQGYHAVLIACVAATLVTEVLAGVGPELSLTMTAPRLAHYPLFAGLGILLGAFGVAFNRLVLAALDLFAGWSERAGWTLVLALSLGLTTLLFTLPAGTGGGEQLVQPLVARHLPLDALLVLLGVRLAATLASYAAGAPGGIFAPILGLATVAGLAFAEAVARFAPQLMLEPAAIAAGAMAALFTASVRAPLVGVVLVAELTDAYSALLAITLCTAMASLTAAALGGEPLYVSLLERTRRLAERKVTHRGAEPCQ